MEDCAALSIEMGNGALVTSSITLGAAEDVSRIKICFSNLTAESAGSPDKPYNPADDEWKFLARDPVTQNQIKEILLMVGSLVIFDDGIRSQFIGTWNAAGRGTKGRIGVVGAKETGGIRV